MSPLDHLTPADRAVYLDRLAHHVAQLQQQHQASTTLIRGQQAIAEALGVSRATAGKLLATQQIKYTRLGRKGYAVTQIDIHNYLQKTA
jgi:predicted AAA+ superfamily ATPase